MNLQERGRCVGIPWYTRATYAESVASMEDRSMLPESYDQWLRAAERVAAHAYEQGLRPIRAYIDAAHFAEWCREHGLRPDGMGRKAFARWVAEDDDRCLAPVRAVDTSSRTAPAAERSRRDAGQLPTLRL